MKIIKYITFTLLVAFAAASCHDFLDINDDPNNPSSVGAALTLPAAELNIATTLNADYAVVGGLWAQHWTQSHVASQYRDEDRYAINRLDYQTAWVEMFAGALVDLKRIEEEAVATGNWNLNLMAVSLTAYGTQVMVDWYDQIPYSEALQGESGGFAPHFDSGESVYADLLARLEAALAQDFTGAGVAQVRSDFIFGHLDKDGQIEAWKQFANTLRLKMWLRQTKVNNAGAQAAIAGLLAEDNFLTQDAKIDIFVDLPNQSNPIYESNNRQLNVKTNLRGSRTLISWLQEYGDPRLDAYFIPGSGGHYGLWQGWFEATPAEVPEQAPDVAILSPTRPVYFFSLDEVYFLLAEAHARYGNGGSAATFYESAVNAACSRVGTDCSALLAGDYAYPNGNLQQNLEAIMMQKWASMVDRGYEAFWDQNRTGIPAVSNLPTFDANTVPGQLTYAVAGVTGGLFPKRLIWPDNERNANANTPAEVPLTEPVWWAK